MIRKKCGVVVLVLGWWMVVWAGCTFEQKPVHHDWPMWRYDAQRSASSPQQLPDALHPLWVCEYPQLTPTWDDPLNRDLMQFDTVYEPVVQGDTLFIGSNTSDCLIALDTNTGAEKWRFYVGGPVRLPAVSSAGKVYFVSDDGHLYCVDAVRGELIWKFQGGPSQRKILGNERLISTWPARGGPVLQDGTIYFAAGIWPFMGVFIYALDADTGDVIWGNDSSGAKYMLQPHNSPSYAGIAPQGSLVIAGDRLLVPGGRSVPACYDLQTGEFLYYHLAKNGKTGGAFVAAQDDFFVNYYRDSVVSLYDLKTGESVLRRFGKIPVITEDRLFSRGNPITAFDLGNIRRVARDKRIQLDQEKGIARTVRDEEWTLNKLWTCDVDASGDLILAGGKLYAGGKNTVAALSVPRTIGRSRVVWETKIEGTVGRIIAADRKLFVVTREDRIYAFGPEAIDSPPFYPHQPQKNNLPEATLAQADSILRASNVREGYSLVYGLENADLVEALARQSDLRMVVVEPDAAKADQLRRRFDAVGLYGRRLSVQTGNIFDLETPPYMASLTLVENLDAAGSQHGPAFFEKLYHSCRPYGGVICLPVNDEQMTHVTGQIEQADLPNAKLRRIEPDTDLLRTVQHASIQLAGSEHGTGLLQEVEHAANRLSPQGYLLLSREGSLPGAADWTHQYGDIANSVKSDDQLVKLPLGVLWFGGNSNMDVLPRHGHGPPEQVIGGRLFIQGIGSMSARDVYTGRVLWKRNLSRLDTFGVYYNETYKDTPLDTAYNQVHIPGANARGTNYVATEDRLYIVLKNSCLVLDAATGKTVDEFRLPPEWGDDPPEWGYIGVYGDYLIAGAGFTHYLDYVELDELTSDTRSKVRPFYNFNVTASRRLVVMDRHTGETLWTRKAKLGFWHNAIAVGDDRIFCIDMLAPSVDAALKRRLGQYRLASPELMCLKVANGRKVWKTTENVFGTWLSYSDEYGILLQSGRQSRDMIRGEPDGLIAYRASDGKVLWQKDISDTGPYMLHGDTIITDRTAYSLLTGKQKMRTDPLTGEQTPWVFRRNYGCNYAIASEYLLTFRSAAAGFYDLLRDGGTGNFGGFKSSCTSNLVVANGVLNAPDYTRTCSCAYQNQTSLALVHMPELELWTTYFEQHKDSSITHAANAVVFSDLDGNIRYVNQACLKLLGYDDDQSLLGEPVSLLWQQASQIDKAMQASQRSGSWSGILQARKADGSSQDIYLFVTVIKDKVRTPVSMMFSLVDATQSAVAFADLDGKLTYVDDEFVELWKLGNERDALEHSFIQLWRGRQEASTVLRAWRRGQNWSGKLVALVDDGSTRNVDVVTHVVTDETGQPTSAVATFFDLTEHQWLASEAAELAPILRDGGNIRQHLAGSRRIKNVGINFGAPGDRRADDGTLWLEYPSVGAPSPELTVKITPEEYVSYSHHSSRIEGEGLKWVVASGIRGISSVTVTLNEARTKDNVSERTYLVRLYFSEPENLEPGQRLLDISLQGVSVLDDFDIVKEAGGTNRPVVKEFSGVLVEDVLTIQLTPGTGAALDETILSGLEILAEQG